MIQAERIKDTDPDRFVKSWAKFQNADLRRAREILLEPHILFSIDPNTVGVTKMWNFMRSVGYIQSNIDIRQRVDVALYKRALDDLTQKSPKDKFYQKLQRRFAAQNPISSRVAFKEDSHKPKLVARLNQVPECCR